MTIHSKIQRTTSHRATTAAAKFGTRFRILINAKYFSRKTAKVLYLHHMWTADEGKIQFQIRIEIYQSQFSTTKLTLKIICWGPRLGSRLKSQKNMHACTIMNGERMACWQVSRISFTLFIVGLCCHREIVSLIEVL